MIEATWPHQACFRDVNMRPVNRTRDMQESLSGEVTPVASHAGHWRLSLTLLIYGEAANLAWKAFISQMAGGLGVCDVPIWERYRAKDKRGHDGARQLVAGLRRAQTFEHFGFAADPVVIAGVRQAFPLRATQMRVDNKNTTGIRPGHRFSINGRFYECTHHWRDDTSEVVRFWPPAREAVEYGATIVLDVPTCRMRLAEDGGHLPYTLSPINEVQIELVEAR